MIARTLPFEHTKTAKRLKSATDWCDQPDNDNRDTPQGVYQDYIEAIKRDVCSWCNNEGGTRDHIVPQAFDGSNHWSNITGACRTCNTKRGHRDILEWLITKTHKRDPSATH